MAESPTISPHAPHHFPTWPPPFPKKQNLSRISQIFWILITSLHPVQLNEGWFCWQMLCILHPESLWTPYFLHHRKEINKHMGVILLLLCWKKMMDQSIFCSTRSTRSLSLPVTGKYFCLPCIVLLTSIHSTYFLLYISADRAMIWAVFNTLETLLTMLPTGTTLAWHGEESVGCGHLSWESKSSGGQLLSPESWYDQWSVAGCWGPSDERLRCHCDIPASQHLDCFLLCFLHPLLYPGSHKLEWL